MEKAEMSGLRPVRKRNRIEQYDYSRNGAYFITICTENRKCLLSHIVSNHAVGATIGRPPRVAFSHAGECVKKAISLISMYYPDVRVDKYVIMPNHIHLLISIDVPCGRPMVAPTVSRVIRQMKGYATKQIGQNIWQKSFHDHVIRTESDYQMIWEYIDTNPARWEQDCFYTEE